MHMSDALLSAPVALTAGVAAACLIAAAGSKMKKETSESPVALMGVTGAFVFAAQMVNFAIPGTGSSGHIVGGVLLGALLGPWAAFLTLASVLIIQCLVFADGGLMALGCNVINMAAMACLVAYPLVFRPIAGRSLSPGRVMAASVAACVAGLELGAVLVTVETALSGVSALPFGRFLALMTGIHLAIGAVEGIATGLVLSFVARTDRSVLAYRSVGDTPSPRGGRVSRIVVWIAVATVAVAGGLAFLASENPDGLEWSIGKLTGGAELAGSGSGVMQAAGNVQAVTSVMPGYESSLSGIVGALMVVALVWAVAAVVSSRRRKAVAVRKR